MLNLHIETVYCLKEPTERSRPIFVYLCRYHVLLTVHELLTTSITNCSLMLLPTCDTATVTL